MKKNIVLITIALLSVLLIVSCSNKTQESKAVGLSITLYILISFHHKAK